MLEENGQVGVLKRVYKIIRFLIFLSKLLEGYVKQNILQGQRDFAMTNNMASSGLRENVTLVKIILNIYGIIGCEKV